MRLYRLCDEWGEKYFATSEGTSRIRSKVSPHAPSTCCLINGHESCKTEQTFFRKAAVGKRGKNGIYLRRRIDAETNITRATK